jgi:hypothetical protein
MKFDGKVLFVFFLYSAFARAGWIGEGLRSSWTHISNGLWCLRSFFAVCDPIENTHRENFPAQIRNIQENATTGSTICSTPKVSIQFTDFYKVVA